MGFADSPATKSVLASHGIRVSGYRWRWAPGLKGGTYPPHRSVNGRVHVHQEDFEFIPGQDGEAPCTRDGDSTCMCALVPAYRTADGKLAKPGLFQPPVTIAQRPVTAAATIEPFDWTPLTAAIEALATQQLVVTIPEGSIVVNVPQQPPPVVNVTPPDVVVEAPNITVEAPNVTVESPTVNVEPPTVNVEAPIVTIEPQIDMPKPAAPKMLPPPKPRETRIVRDETTGVIIGMKEIT